MSGTNQSKITISLKRHEREAIEAEAERQGLKPCQLVAAIVRSHIKTASKITKRPRRANETGE